MTRTGGDARMRILLIGSVVLLLALGLLFNTRNASSGPRSGPPLSMHASVDHGARGLALWLGELGYAVEPLEYRPWGVPDGTDVLFILAPTRDITAAQADTVRDWVERGGHLIIGIDAASPLLEAFDINLAYSTGWMQNATPTVPLAGQALNEVTIETTTHLVGARDGWLPTLVNREGNTTRVVGATRTFGRGQVQVVSTIWPFSNIGIREADNAAFVRGLLGGHPANGSTRILFDEYHHGRTEHGTLTARIVREPWGWAIVYAFAVGFIWIAWSGVRFGRAQQAARAASRRTSGEYITTLATALRQNRQQPWLQQQYAAQVRRRLARRYRIRTAPGDDSDTFMARIIERQPRLAALAAPLQALEQGMLAPEAATAQMQAIEQLLQEIGAERPGIATHSTTRQP